MARPAEAAGDFIGVDVVAPMVPARPGGHARRHRRRLLVPLRRGQLRHRPGARRQRRHVHLMRRSMADPLRYRVVQWTTGNVGKSSRAGHRGQPARSSWSAATRGRPTRSAATSGELCGIEPVGITATDDVDALLALQPDCVVYNPMWTRHRRAGADPLGRRQRGVHGGLHHRPQPRPRPRSDARRVRAGRRHAVRHRHQPGLRRAAGHRVGDASATASTRSPSTRPPTPRSTTRPTPSARPASVEPIDHPDLAEMTAQGTAVFGEAVRLVADALGVELDEVRCEAEHAQTTGRPGTSDRGPSPPGCVAGIAASWKGLVGDEGRRRAQRPLAQGSPPSSPTGRSSRTAG